MLNNLGLPAIVLLVIAIVIVYVLAIRPAIQRAKTNGTNTMYEISPIFWMFCSVLFGGLGSILLYYASDPQLFKDALLSGANPFELAQVQNSMKTYGYIGLGIGGILLALGLARGILFSNRQSP